MISSFLNRQFVKMYSINMDEAEKSINEYPSIGDLFIRKLKPGVRPIADGLVHPADADLTQKGVLLTSSDQKMPMIQAKGFHYTLDSFLYDKEVESKFQEGHYLTYYLCPTDYHRVHSPISGEIFKTTYIPGNLWPVNAWSVNHIPELFSINERVVVWIKSDLGLLALVLVGATNVGKMTLSFDPDVMTNQGERAVLEKSYDKPISIEKGEEVGLFNMGSTVILAYSKGFEISIDQVRLGPTRLGEKLY